MDIRRQGIARKGGKAFAKMLLSSATQIDIRTLTKLLNLMTNMLEDYLSEVTVQTWRLFTQALASQSEAIETVIRQEQGPLRKKKAEAALENLVLAFQKHRFRFLLEEHIAA